MRRDHNHLVSAVSLIITLCAVAAFASERQVPLSGKTTRVDSLMKEGEVAGMAMTTVDSGKVGATQVFGSMNLRTHAPIASNTVFEAASLSKPVVAYGLLKLVDDGSVALDVPASRYIDVPDLHADSRWNSITVRMLLDHTSGLPNELHPRGAADDWLRAGNPFQLLWSGILTGAGAH